MVNPALVFAKLMTQTFWVERGIALFMEDTRREGNLGDV
jgi:hypothetical protein